MKVINKFGLAVLSAILMLGSQSCHKDIPQQDGKYPILFGNYETRATAGLDDLQDNGFKVYAYFKGNTDDSATFEKNVTYNSAQNVWGYEELEYWIPGVTYWFKAFYPSTPSAGALTVNNTSSEQIFSIADFDITKQEDIMVATAYEEVEDDKQAPNNGSVVNLVFEHLLANVTIKVKSQIDGVTIQKITLGGIDTNSEYNGNVWRSSNTTSIEYNSSTTLTKGADYVDVTGGGILVVPARSNKSLTVEANKTYNLTFPAGTWEPGNRYTYTIEIKQDDIVFVDNAPYVEDWDSENATGSVIIK